ncbi:putative cucumisin [Helianthus annuus]|nr:putative cucumisin [Helianthus annuus]
MINIIIFILFTCNMLSFNNFKSLSSLDSLLKNESIHQGTLLRVYKVQLLPHLAHSPTQQESFIIFFNSSPYSLPLLLISKTTENSMAGDIFIFTGANDDNYDVSLSFNYMQSVLELNASLYSKAEFAYGSRHIDPLKGIDPGLVYENSVQEYFKMCCNISQTLGSIIQKMLVAL